LHAAGIPVASIDMRRGRPDPRPLLRLAGILRLWRPAILHSHMVHANLVGRVARLLYWMPVQVSTAHNVREGGRALDLAYRFTDPLCTLTTNVSAAAVSRYIRTAAVPASKIRCVPNGIDTHSFRPDRAARARLRAELGFEEGHLIWLAAGRLVEAKDHASLLEVFAVVYRAYPIARLLVAGSGPLEAAIRARATALGLAGTVVFLGVRDDVAALMQAADAYVLSSRWEGLPTVLLEAAGCGLPIVATDVGGNREIVQDGGNGWLVPPARPDLLAGAMEQLMVLTPSEREHMGRAGIVRIAGSYSLDSVVRQWDTLYRELLGEAAPGPPSHYGNRGARVDGLPTVPNPHR